MIKDRNLFFGDANSCIGHGKADEDAGIRRWQSCRPHAYFAGLSELNGISHKIDQNLPQAGRITDQHLWNVSLDRPVYFQAFLVSPNGEGMQGTLNAIQQ